MEWLIEEGIGEHRALLIDGAEAVAARIDWPGRAGAGLVADAVLIHRAGGSKRGVIRLPSGEEALVDRLPREASEGAPIRIEITRAALAETGRFKLAKARPTDKPLRPAFTLAQQTGGKVVRAFPEGLWEDVWGEAWSGEVPFAGGALVLTPAPAMTVIDIDGPLPAPALCLAAVPALAGAVRRMDLAGSIGVDFPTLFDKSDRQAVDAALAEALQGYAHERTATNGFGFVQIVARLERPSLLARLQHTPVGAAARFLLRRAERVSEAGVLLIRAPSAVLAAITPAWEEELARRTGRRIHREVDDTLALDGGFAQAIAS